MRTLVAVSLVIACSLALGARAPVVQSDRLAAEISRWSSILERDTRTDDPLWLDAKKSAATTLAQAREALTSGLRLAALERFAQAQQTLSAALYVNERPRAERQDLAAFEAEWKRVGLALQDVVSPQGRAIDSAATVRPAVARALAELAVTQAHDFYAASLEYGRNTEPQFGLFYLGAAQAQRRFVDFVRETSETSRSRPPALRSVASEVDALQKELLAAYRPPASIDRHPEFITASAGLKEAREQDKAGHRYAALLRYLQSAQRVAMIRATESSDAAEVKRRLDETAKRLIAANVDHTIGQLFIERARSALASDNAASGGLPAARAIAFDVLPRYFAALEPARPVTPAPQPQITVTLVRWPFT
jgi:hypothetical protein